MLSNKGINIKKHDRVSIRKPLLSKLIYKQTVDCILRNGYIYIHIYNKWLINLQTDSVCVFLIFGWRHSYFKNFGADVPPSCHCPFVGVWPDQLTSILIESRLKFSFREFHSLDRVRLSDAIGLGKGNGTAHLVVVVIVIHERDNQGLALDSDSLGLCKPR